MRGLVGCVAAALCGVLLCAGAGLTPAQASEYCVGGATGSEGCGAGVFPASGLSSALSLAAATPEPDSVRVGAGSYAGPFTYAGASPLTLTGAGPEATILTNAGGAAALSLTASLPTGPHRISDLGAEVTAGAGAVRGIALAGGAELSRVRVTTPGATDGVAVETLATASPTTITDTEIVTDGADVGISSTGGAPLTVRDTTITRTGTVAGTGTGVRYGSSVGGIATLEAVRVRDMPLGVQLISGELQLNGVLVDLGAQAGAIGVDVGNVTDSSATASASVHATTIVGTGGGQVGVRVHASGAGSAASGATLGSSVVALDGAGARSLVCERTGALTIASINGDTIALRPATPDIGAGCDTLFAGRIDLDATDPGFRDPLGRDYTPIPGSPLLDAGTVSVLPDIADDILGRARLVDGTGDGIVVRDIGAFEYQRRAPDTPTTLVSTTIPTAGQPVSFFALSEDPDGETTTIHWDFGDGTTASGMGTTHVYAQAGTFTATATATDPAGRIAAAQVTLTVAPADPVATTRPDSGRTSSGGGSAPPGATSPPTGGTRRDIAAPRVRGRRCDAKAPRTGGGWVRRATVRAGRTNVLCTGSLSEAAVIEVQMHTASGRPLPGITRVRAPGGFLGLDFGGRWRGRLLAPGRYRARLVFQDAAGNRSAPVTIAFRLTRPPRG